MCDAEMLILKQGELDVVYEMCSRIIQERDDARRWAVRLEQLLAAETAAAYRLLFKAYGIPEEGAGDAG